MATALQDIRLTPLGVAEVIRDLLIHSEDPATLILQKFAGTALTLQAKRPEERPLRYEPGSGNDEAYRLGAEPIVRCRYREGILKTPGGLTAAFVNLVWLPCRLPWKTCKALNAGEEPAGVILNRLEGGMRRVDRRAGVEDRIDKVTGERVIVEASAVLFANGSRVAIAHETIPWAFAEWLAPDREDEVS